MGALDVPARGLVYVDSNCVIYAIEKIEPYSRLLTPLWEAAARGQASLVASELVLMEVLIKPVQAGNRAMESLYRRFLEASTEFRLIPISRSVINEAVRVRAEHRISTPDAIHAATALLSGADSFVTNDPDFQRVAGLSVTLLQSTT